MKPNPKALVIDEDRATRRLLRTVLQENCYRVVESENGRQGIAEANVCDPDIILVELAAPDLKGLVLLRRLSRARPAPVLVLSKLSSEKSIVSALDAGACAYITKPFGNRELLARLRLALRTDPQETRDEVLEFGDVRADLSHRRVSVKGRPIDLSPIEGCLARELLLHSGKYLPIPYLQRSIWGWERKDVQQSMRVFISSLRRKLRNAGSTLHIELAEKLGYRLIGTGITQPVARQTI